MSYLFFLLKFLIIQLGLQSRAHLVPCGRRQKSLTLLYHRRLDRLKTHLASARSV